LEKNGLERPVIAKSTIQLTKKIMQTKGIEHVVRQTALEIIEPVFAEQVTVNAYNICN
jgi:uncharacterized protein (DUF362 family)|tara:strand:+ start:78 stop:251 length:174 start_codon:yes stop_codon:yes gene_type:complete